LTDERARTKALGYCF